MSQSRYREARTLVRRLCRLPKEDRAAFKGKIARLREHFERFNVDVSELCQWLMGLRRQSAVADRPASFGVLGDFLLAPSLEGLDADEQERDRWRLAVFNRVAGFRPIGDPAGRPLPAALRDAMAKVADQRLTPTADQRLTPTATRLFGRLRPLEPAHRLVLLKAAAEWIVARYQRGIENWVRQHDEWQKEKTDWEGRHPALTDQVRERFTNVFRTLNDPEKNDKPGLRRKNPRICPYERISGNLDNCIYAGQKGHGPLCWKYAEFVKARKQVTRDFNDKLFAEDARNFLSPRKQAQTRDEALRLMFPDDQPAQQRFLDNWTAYLQALKLNAKTVSDCGRLPHCLKIGETWEKSKCEWNPHTELCKQYKLALDQFDAETRKLEPDYREWRRLYLAGPRKPSFRYPSSRDLPMPKIFGEGFHEIDLDRSVLRLRLDDMPKGDWLEFGFTPWPRGYHPSKDEVWRKLTSVHVNFVGARARAGFRFDVPHRQSRFGCSQDEIDELRSRKFPRQAQDQQFLEAARARLLESFSGGADGDVRLLAVDLGEKGAHAAVYHGRTHEKDVPLEIVKINKLYDRQPESLQPDSRGRPAKREFKPDDPRGLRKEHVGRHLLKLAEGAAQVATRRQAGGTTAAVAAGHDFRGLKGHVAWMIRDWVRHNAAQVMAAAEKHKCDLIVFESLRGFRAPGFDKIEPDKKRWLAMFAYGRIRRKVVEKAVERGMRVVTAPYFKSSQFCSACGHEQRNAGRWRKNKKNRSFKCECGDSKASTGPRHGGKTVSQSAATASVCTCTAGLDSDANAARVLARVFWGEITLPSPESRPGA